MNKLFPFGIVLLFLLFQAGISFSRQDNKGIAREAFTVAEQMPSFPGGTDALNKYLRKHLKYPLSAAEKGLSGNVVLRFIVGADGAVSDIEVIDSLDPDCDKEAVRAIAGMPGWDPGMQNGAFVSVYYILPITFAMH